MLTKVYLSNIIKKFPLWWATFTLEFGSNHCYVKCIHVTRFALFARLSIYHREILFPTWLYYSTNLLLLDCFDVFVHMISLCIEGVLIQQVHSQPTTWNIKLTLWVSIHNIIPQVYEVKPNPRVMKCWGLQVDDFMRILPSMYSLLDLKPNNQYLVRDFEW